MNGNDLLGEIKRRIMKERGTKTVADNVVANFLGITQPALVNIKGKELSPRQIGNLLEKYHAARQRELVQNTVLPIVEFLHIDPVEKKRAAGWQIFGTGNGGDEDNRYLSGLRERLEQKHGIYVFHDSRGRAIYAGKAQKLSLWAEMNNAFNRDRKEVQSIKRVCHPSRNVLYRGPEEKERQIVKEPVALHHIASYFSAYEVPDMFISKFEALIVRAFANDLLNVRMEKF